jgi:5-methyltetrahydrofolate--homocysteine methyltransferase
MKTLADTANKRVLLADGAMGTQLQNRGLEPGGCGEHWNVTQPDKVLEIQKSYVAAGADCLLTNTFGACSITLTRHRIANDMHRINTSAVAVARAALESTNGFVIGDVGPFGGLLNPYGDATKDEVRDALGAQIRALLEAGADAILIETQTAIEELAIGTQCARDAGAPCIIGSMAFDLLRKGDGVKTMMGIGPDDAARMMVDAGIDILGANCGAGVDVEWIARIAERYHSIADLPVWAKPNAGLPELDGMNVVYRDSPELMAEQLPKALQAGVNIFGGCCGTTPAHIAAFRTVIDTWNEQHAA